jgi:acyl-CoA synthetase (AMP-forming)/AMP-acid ligase II
MIQGTQQSLRLAAGLTLDRLLRHAASQRRDQIALIDPPNREDFTAGAPRALTYAQADRAVNAIAARLCSLSLMPDHVVALQLPNSVEGVLAFLGVLRAGLIASPLPLLWRRADCAAARAMIDMRAFVTASRIGAANHCEIAMHAAADGFMVRHVGLFGGSHDGMVALDDTLNE